MQEGKGMKKIYLVVVMVLAVVLICSGCSSQEEEKKYEEQYSEAHITFYAPTQKEVLDHIKSLDTEKYELISDVYSMNYGNSFKSEILSWAVDYKEVKNVENSHTWTVREEEEKIKVVCEECGEVAK